MCRLKYKLWIALFTFVFSVITISVWRSFQTPQIWNEIHIGMTRQEVLEKVGPASQDWGEIKGYWWIKDELTGCEELWIYFTDDRVSDLDVKRYFGTSEHFTWQLIRSESVP